jgi:rRNA maturation RNase YbeY
MQDNTTPRPTPPSDDALPIWEIARVEARVAPVTFTVEVLGEGNGGPEVIATPLAAMGPAVDRLPQALEALAAHYCRLMCEERLGLFTHLNLDVLETLSVDVLWVTNAGIQALNAETRQKDEPTDVLSFPTMDPDTPAGIITDLPEQHLGTLYLSIPWCLTPLRENAYPFLDTPSDVHPALHRLLALTAHGLLHLAGVHHETPEAFEAMLHQQARLVAPALDVVRH